MKTVSIFRPFVVTAILLLALGVEARAQFNVEGDFRVRWYSDSFTSALDNRGKENYMRYLGHLRGKTRISSDALFFTELVTLIDNPGQPVRNIAGTGPMRFGVSQLYADLNEQDFLGLDVVRFRIGRQQFPIGNGLSMGESYYFQDKFDGMRVDMLYAPVTLSVFGAILGQNLSSSGLYPDPGSDQLYAARVGTVLWSQDLLAYAILHKPRGLFNDNLTIGGGAKGQVFFTNLEYFAEAAHQTWNTAPGLPASGGIGLMGGLGYRWGMGPFRSIKVEGRYAAYEGDNAKTRYVERFSPPYPSFFWGSRAGYVNGDVGGDFPRNGVNLEGSRILYARVYVIPRDLPKVRVQFQYVKVSEWVDNNGVNGMDDEISARFYFALTPQSQLQARYSHAIPNAPDTDLDGGGTITSTEDRMHVHSVMFEWQIYF